MKFLVPNYSCLQNSWLGGYVSRSPFSLSSVLNWICWNPSPRKKIPGYATAKFRIGKWEGERAMGRTRRRWESDIHLSVKKERKKERNRLVVGCCGMSCLATACSPCGLALTHDIISPTHVTLLGHPPPKRASSRTGKEMRMVAVASWIWWGGKNVWVQLPGFDLRPVIGAAIWFPNLNWIYIRKGVSGDAVGWGTALQAGRSRVRFLMISLEFFIDVILPAELWPWGWLSV